MINALSDVQFEANASDFFGVSRRAVEVLKQSYREKVRFLRGYVQNLGFRRTRLEYEAGVRVAGVGGKGGGKSTFFLICG